MKRNFVRQRGQALITLLIFMMVATAVTTAAVMIVVNSTRASSIAGSSAEALIVADSGAENAILRLLRNTSYTGETLTIGEGTSTITVITNGSTKVIQSVGTLGNYRRTVEVQVSYVNNVLTVSSWRQMY